MEFILTLKAAEGYDEEAIVPDSVMEIGPTAFRDKRKLKRVILPESCTAIGECAFEGCRSLEEIELPASLESIGSFAFKNCTSLKRIVLPDGIREIPKQAFARCIALSAVEGAQNLKTIDLDAFTGCVGLTSFDASSARTIGDRAFSGCRSLQHIDFGADLRSIGHYAFRSCVQLREVTIPEGTTNLGDDVFAGCSDITVEAPDEMIRAFPDSFPRALVLSRGIIRQQDIRTLTAQFRRNHAQDAADLEQRRNELSAHIETLDVEIAHLGILDLKEHDAVVAQRAEALAELDDIAALLHEIDYPSIASLKEEFAAPSATS